jgi:enoyl-CoA hydratase/carnithine racemase
MADDVELSVSGEVATILLRRPTLGNALRGAMFDQLRKIGLKLTDNPPRFVVIGGEGPDFCVGLDRDRADSLYQQFEPVVRSRDAFRTQELLTRLRSSFDLLGRAPCPIVAAIEGRCAGAGLELALVADVRVVAEDAVLAFDDVQHGLVTGLGGLVRAVNAVGGARTMERVLTGRPITAAEALELGLASRVAPKGGAMSAALELVQEMRRGSTIARTQALLAVRAIQGRLANDLLEQESQAAARTWIAPDWQNALQGAPAKPQ